MKRYFIFIFLLLITFLTFFLGCWQVKRFFYKKNLISNLNKEVQLFASVENVTVKDHLSPFMIAGQVVGPKIYFFYSYNLYKVLVPLKIHGTNKVVYTDCGLTDVYKKKNISFGNVITGIAHIMFHNELHFIKNNVKDNIWFWYDYDALSNNLGEKVEPYTFYFMDYNTNNIKQNQEIKIHNIHYIYIIFWYSMFCCGIIVLYLCFLRKN